MFPRFKLMSPAEEGNRSSRAKSAASAYGLTARAGLCQSEGRG